jgi:hypothetical protein
MAESAALLLSIGELDDLVGQHHLEFMQQYSVHSVSHFVSGDDGCQLDEEELDNLTLDHQTLIKTNNAYVVVLLVFYDRVHESQQKELDDEVNVINSAYECTLPKVLQPYRSQIKAVAIKQPQSVQ